MPGRQIFQKEPLCVCRWRPIALSVTFACKCVRRRVRPSQHRNFVAFSAAVAAISSRIDFPPGHRLRPFSRSAPVSTSSCCRKSKRFQQFDNLISEQSGASATTFSIGARIRSPLQRSVSSGHSAVPSARHGHLFGFLSAKSDHNHFSPINPEISAPRSLPTT
jgi:hypothetical protein